MTAVSYHDTVNDLQDLDWCEAGPFGRVQWFGLLEKSSRNRPLYAQATSGSRGLVLPLLYGPDGLHSLASWYAFTWNALHTPGGPHADLAECIARDLVSRTSRLHLTRIGGEDAALKALEDAFRKAGWHAYREVCDTNHVLPVRGRSFAQFMAGRPGRVRTTLQRKARMLDVHVSARFNAADWTCYEAIYADSWKPAEGDPHLLRAFAREESAHGRYRFALAWAEGEPVAAQFWTVDQGTAYIHKLAHRTSAERLSPGTVLTAALFERVIDIDGVNLVDFGTGDDPYKRDWMEQVRERWDLTCMRPMAPRNWPIMGKHILRKLVSPASRG